jgi:hypothetical protein
MSATQGQVAVNLLGEQIQFAHTVLEGTIEGVTAEVATTKPPGLARSIGSYYAHILIAEDLVINGMLQQQAPLFAGDWRDRTGFDGPPPADPAQWPAWSSQAQGDVVSSRAYAQAVYAATAAYLSRLTDADLAHKVDLSAVGFGEQTVGWLLSAFVLANCNWHTGEISCLKGDHGLKGYPF